MIKIVLLYFLILILSQFSKGNEISFAKDIEVKVTKNNGDLAGGTGFLVKVDPSIIEINQSSRPLYFIITAAHITKGLNPKILINKSEISNNLIKGRVYDFFNDIEIIQVDLKNNYTPLAELKKDTADNFYFLTHVERKDGVFKFSPTNTLLSPSITVGKQFDLNTQKIIDLPSFIFFPDKNYDYHSDNINSIFGQQSTLDIIQESSYGNTLFTPYSGVIAPGMSGAPLIQFKRINDKLLSIIEGVTIQYYRKGSKSFFTSVKIVFELIKKYISGSRNTINSTDWKYDDAGNVYRQVDLCSNESNNLIMKKCQIIKESTFTENRINDNKYFDVKVNSDDGGVRGDGTEDSAQTLPELKMPPSSLIIDEERVYGFKVNSHNSNDSIVIEANWAALDYYIKNKELKKIEFIKSNFNFIELFLNHFTNQNLNTTKLPYTITYDSNPDVKVQIETEWIELTLPGIPLASLGNSDSNSRDQITIKIDKNGHIITKDLNTQKEFVRSYEPVIKVRGFPSTTEYYVDIRQLFFLDISEIPKDFRYYVEKFHLDKIHQNSDLENVIKESYFRGPIISITLAKQRANSSIYQIYLPKKKPISMALM